MSIDFSILRREVKYSMENLFCKRLEWSIKFRRLKVADVATEVGLQPKTIYAFMRGDVFPSFESLNKLAEVLNVSADFLLGRVDDYNGTVLEKNEEPLKDEILFIRRAYSKLSPEERRIITTLAKTLIKDKEDSENSSTE
jgi:transcriptional regulator with XRE-family HTH domain